MKCFPGDEPELVNDLVIKRQPIVNRFECLWS